MDWTTIFNLISAAPQIKKWIDIGLPVVTELQKAHPKLIPVLEKIGAEIFPSLAGTIHTVAAAADVLFDPHGTMWVQEHINKLLPPTPLLVIDGRPGKLTQDAVKAYQTKFKLKIDGYVGKETEASMVAELAKLPA